MVIITCLSLTTKLKNNCNICNGTFYKSLGPLMSHILYCKLRLAPFDLLRKAREFVVKKKIRKLNQKNYRKNREKYRRLKVRLVDGRRTIVTYNLKALSKKVCFQNIHLSEYAGKKELLDILCRLRKGQILSAAPSVVAKWSLSNWWKILPEAVKKLVHTRSLTRKFWTEKRLKFVEGLVRIKHSYNEISAMLYHLYYHKIKTFSLVKMAIRRGWIPTPRGPPRRPPKNY